MTKRDFQAIARAIHEAKPDTGPTQVWDSVTHSIANALSTLAPRFDRARFLEACETGRCKGMRG